MIRRPAAFVFVALTIGATILLALLPTSDETVRGEHPDDFAEQLDQAIAATTTSSTTTTTTTSTTTTTTPPSSTTTTTPPPSPHPHVRSVGSCAGWETLIAAHFPPEQVAKACAVMMCETGGTGDPTIHNPSSTASGLWQFLDGTWVSTTGLPAPAATHPPDVQTAGAAALWRSSGWGPWACA